MITGYDKKRNHEAINSVAGVLGLFELTELTGQPIPIEFIPDLRKELQSVAIYLTELSAHSEQ
jgi:hypothetical protein